MISAKKNFVYSTFARLYVIICLIIYIEYDIPYYNIHQKMRNNNSNYLNRNVRLQ
jgi:hypothetical protein